MKILLLNDNKLKFFYGQVFESNGVNFLCVLQYKVIKKVFMCKIYKIEVLSLNYPGKTHGKLTLISYDAEQESLSKSSQKWHK